MQDKRRVTGIFPPRKVPGFAKYAVDANLFRLESSILTRAKRAANRNNVATEKRGGGGNFPGGSIPRTFILQVRYMTESDLK